MFKLDDKVKIMKAESIYRGYIGRIDLIDRISCKSKVYYKLKGSNEFFAEDELKLFNEKMELEEIYVEKIKKLKPEINCRQHCTGDMILCQLLNQLGYESVVKEYKKIPKCYPSLGEKEIITNNDWEGKIVHRIKNENLKNTK